MNYNINFQVAAVIITALLLYHFLTQKKLHNANVKTFTYILYSCIPDSRENEKKSGALSVICAGITWL